MDLDHDQRLATHSRLRHSNPDHASELAYVGGGTNTLEHYLLDAAPRRELWEIIPSIVCDDTERTTEDGLGHGLTSSSSRISGDVYTPGLDFVPDSRVLNGVGDGLAQSMSVPAAEHPRYYCSECRGSFADKKGLGRHQQSKHTKTRPLSCKWCGYATARQDNLTRHMKIRHTDRREAVRPAQAHMRADTQVSVSETSFSGLPGVLPREPERTSQLPLSTSISSSASRGSSTLLKSNYEWLAADTIRLVWLRQQQEDDPDGDIQVFLQHVHMTELASIPYEALSYCWGDGDTTMRKSITQLDDSQWLRTANASPSKRRELWITSELYTALRCLRLTQGARVLWIDQLCINQADLDERSSQITCLSQIYARATNVVVWLGQSEARTEQAMHTLSSISAQKDVLGFKDDTSRLQSVQHLMERPWFHRLWAIQELALASAATVMCGMQQMRWRDFQDAVSMLSDYAAFAQDADGLTSRSTDQLTSEIEPILTPGKRMIEVTNSVLRVHSTNFDGTPAPIHSLEFLVSAFAGYRAHDPRDTIYALLGIAKEVLRPGSLRTPDSSTFKLPPPNYRWNLLQVYSTFLQWVCLTTKSLNIICRRWALPECQVQSIHYPKLVALPSWIQTIESHNEDPIRGLRRHGNSFVGLPDQAHYDACNGVPASAEFPSLVNTAFDSTDAAHDRALQITGRTEAAVLSQLLHHRLDASLHAVGLVVGSLQSVLGPIAEGVLTSPMITALYGSSWIDDVRASPVPDEVWRFLVAERGEDGQNPPLLYGRACQLMLREHTWHGHVNTKELLSKTKPGFIQSFLRRVQGVIWDRCVIGIESSRSSTPLHGLGPNSVQPGDLLCILYGCSVPVVLRECHDTSIGQYYTLIGEAYVYGIMDGQFVASMTEEDLQAATRNFRIL